MNPRDIELQIPSELLKWLRAEAKRCHQTVEELVKDILETRMLFENKERK